jgi:hypothetical protein
MDMKLVLVAIALGLTKVANADNLDVNQQGNNFEISVLQTTGDNLLQGSVIGDSNKINSIQSGGASASFSIENAGGPVNLTIQQNDSTDSVSVTKICTDPAGCSISVNQN